MTILDALKALASNLGAASTDFKTKSEAVDAIADLAEGELVGSMPAVSADDNGKLMTVVEGAWAKAAAPVELPTVSADDNGKVLMVVEGVWAAAALPADESEE